MPTHSIYTLGMKVVGTQKGGRGSFRDQWLRQSFYCSIVNIVRIWADLNSQPHEVHTQLQKVGQSEADG